MDHDDNPVVDDAAVGSTYSSSATERSMLINITNGKPQPKEEGKKLKKQGIKRGGTPTRGERIR
jgi:hypothetical protein